MTLLASHFTRTPMAELLCRFALLAREYLQQFVVRCMGQLRRPLVEDLPAALVLAEQHFLEHPRLQRLVLAFAGRIVLVAHDHFEEVELLVGAFNVGLGLGVANVVSRVRVCRTRSLWVCSQLYLCFFCDGEPHRADASPRRRWPSHPYR